MADKQLLKDFYLIVDELEKNLIRFEELDEQLKVAKEKNDVEAAQKLLKEYEIVSKNIEALKIKSEKLKENK